MEQIKGKPVKFATKIKPISAKLDIPNIQSSLKLFDIMGVILTSLNHPKCKVNSGD